MKQSRDFVVSYVTAYVYLSQETLVILQLLKFKYGCKE